MKLFIFILKYIKETWQNFKRDIPVMGKIISVYLIIISLNLGSVFVSHKLHSWSQHNKMVYEIVMVTDFMEFMCNGGGAFGYQNQYKWAYAKWVNNPERTSLQKFLFWKHGFVYDASRPPEKYPYPPLF